MRKTLLTGLMVGLLTVVMAVPAVADGHLVTELKKKHDQGLLV